MTIRHHMIELPRFQCLYRLSRADALPPPQAVRPRPPRAAVPVAAVAPLAEIPEKAPPAAAAPTGRLACLCNALPCRRGREPRRRRARRLRLRQFKKLHELGSGAFATVYLAAVRRPRQLPGAPTHAALKELKLDPFNKTQLSEMRVERDAHALVCGHPHVATLYGVVRRPRRVLLAVEHMPGGTLSSALRANCGAFPAPVALDIARQLASALSHMHARGVAHRDVKQENVMLSHPFVPVVGENVAKLIDFGLALRFAPADEQSRLSTEYAGTEEYMTPDATRGKLHDVAKADVYALGALLYEMLSDTYAFDGPETVELMWKRNVYLRKTRPLRFDGAVWAQVSPGTKTLLSAMLSAEEVVRPTAAKVVETLQRLTQ